MLSLCFAVPNEDTNLTAVDLSSSIYAPLLGATGRTPMPPPPSPSFQSTHPLRGATFAPDMTSARNFGKTVPLEIDVGGVPRKIVCGFWESVTTYFRALS